MVVLLAASVSQYMSASSIVTEQTRRQSAGVVNELSVNLDHYFDMVRNSFEYIANNNTVQEELESDEPYKSDWHRAVFLLFKIRADQKAAFAGIYKYLYE